MYVAPGIMSVSGITLVDRVSYLLSVDVECLPRGCASSDPLCPDGGKATHIIARAVESRGSGVVPHAQEIGPCVDDDGMPGVTGSKQGTVSGGAGYDPGPRYVGKVGGYGQAGITGHHARG